MGHYFLDRRYMNFCAYSFSYVCLTVNLMCIEDNCLELIFMCGQTDTVCPRSNDPFYIVAY